MQVGGWGCSFLQAISSPNCGPGGSASSRRGFPASLRLADPLCRIVGAAEKRHPAQTPLPPPPQRAPKQLEQKFNARRTPRGQEQAEGKDKEPPEGGKASGGAEGATIPSTRPMLLTVRLDKTLGLCSKHINPTKQKERKQVNKRKAQTRKGEAEVDEERGIPHQQAAHNGPKSREQVPG
ncbi:hypothetical protein Anapl_10613 [Anas platyrhynchos]|uniref:Uncharacterized protein n=1 Tax=Anas platyrhynchos TaxID=8839 RepID=R0JKX0_ANAPL|nr:hypothetical protein Anapl_10613 [Anas platyrhynchos]